MNAPQEKKDQGKGKAPEQSPSPSDEHSEFGVDAGSEDKGKAPIRASKPSDEHRKSEPEPDTANVSFTKTSVPPHTTTTSSPASQIPSAPSPTTASTLESASASVAASLSASAAAGPASSARLEAALGWGTTQHSDQPPAASSSNTPPKAPSAPVPDAAPSSPSLLDDASASEIPISNTSAPATSTLPSSTSATASTTLESEEHSARELCRYFNLQVNDDQTVEEALATVSELMSDPWFRRTRPRPMGWMDPQLWISLRETAIMKLRRVVEERMRLAEGEDNNEEDSGESPRMRMKMEREVDEETRRRGGI
ncbi:hypothetical protein BJX66DRAFT_340282 [Aspergillus keveii]|uniref:Uncharacterized protein n=1 Tax=Aspergillus keveii TaxID=714993 RepID=A0ABR4FYL6_9EURO